MKNNRTFALAAVAALALASAHLAAAQQPPAPQPAAPQQSTPAVQATVSTPAVTIKRPQPKLDRYRGRVLAFNMAVLIVQSTDNLRQVWSFQYSTELHSKVVDMLGSGGYQPGDKVTVFCNPGTTVAVKIKGKPSKSS